MTIGRDLLPEIEVRSVVLKFVAELLYIRIFCSIGDISIVLL